MNCEPEKPKQGYHNGHFLVNLWQSAEDRAAKYWLAKSLGANSYDASRMRDWRLPKIERRFGLIPVTPSHRPSKADKRRITKRMAPFYHPQPAVLTI